MTISETIREFALGAVDWNQRPVSLHFGRAQATLGPLVALQHASIHESLMDGVHGHLSCVSARADLSPKLFLGIPVSVRLVTDRGEIRAINAIVEDVRIGQSDGELTIYQFTVCDALSLLDKRINSRIFLGKSVIDIVGIMLSQWRQRSPALACAFEFDLSTLDANRYPARELTRQVNESDARFVRRLLRRNGINVFVKSGSNEAARGAAATSSSSSAGSSTSSAASDSPVHTLVFVDDPTRLDAAPAGTVRLHQRDAGTEQRDTITLFALRRCPKRS